MFKWYIVQTHSGFESKVCDLIREGSVGSNLSEMIEEVFVPKQKVLEFKRGKKVESEKSYFPGYVLVKLSMNDEIWHFIRSLPKVNGFLGSQNNPSVVSQSEVDSVYKKIESDVLSPLVGSSYSVGEGVKITEGPFESFVGVVESIDESKSTIKVLVTIFGRETPLDLDYTQVEKV